MAWATVVPLLLGAFGLGYGLASRAARKQAASHQSPSPTRLEGQSAWERELDLRLRERQHEDEMLRWHATRSEQSNALSRWIGSGEPIRMSDLTLSPTETTMSTNAIAVNLDAEIVNRMVAEAILRSKIGESLKKAVDEEVEKLGRTYNSPFASMIQSHISAEVSAQIATNYRDLISAKVKEYLEVQLTEDAIGRIVEKAYDRYR